MVKTTKKCHQMFHEVRFPGTFSIIRHNVSRNYTNSKIKVKCRSNFSSISDRSRKTTWKQTKKHRHQSPDVCQLA